MPAVVLQKLQKTFEKGQRVALQSLDAEIPEGKITGLVGPDGAGKTTLLRILAGLMRVEGGSCRVWGHDTETAPEKIQENLGYLPQKFGLYEDLTVSQNLSLYAELQGVSENDPIFHRLIAFSGLGPFLGRLAGNLSGGMKQKLGLMATLLRKPRLLLLDEPTVGVDPLSQRELWKMVFELKKQEMTLVVATSYLEEAEKCDYVLVLNEGRLLYSGSPENFKDLVKGRTFRFERVGGTKRTVLDRLIGKHGILDAIVEGDHIRTTFRDPNPSSNPLLYDLPPTTTLVPREPHFEDAFIFRMGGLRKRPGLVIPQKSEKDSQAVVEAHDLVRYFGSFKAVNHVSFSIQQGEIFGLLGPNGAGKSTTFKMLCGLLQPSEGEALVGGISLRTAPGKARSLIGYMAQKFSLYDNMTVIQNLRFSAGIYPVEFPQKSIDQMLSVFDLSDHKNTLTKSLSLGYKQRLALSCALMHHPHILFLDEPTSGVDPLTRREFWHQINLLAASGVSILVSTHLMDEAEYCDRIGLIHQGCLKAMGTPEELKKQISVDGAPEPSLFDVFLHFCSEAEDKRDTTR